MKKQLISILFIIALGLGTSYGQDFLDGPEGGSGRFYIMTNYQGQYSFPEVNMNLINDEVIPLNRIGGIGLGLRAVYRLGFSTSIEGGIDYGLFDGFLSGFKKYNTISYEFPLLITQRIMSMILAQGPSDPAGIFIGVGGYYSLNSIKENKDDFSSTYESEITKSFVKDFESYNGSNYGLMAELSFGGTGFGLYLQFKKDLTSRVYYSHELLKEDVDFKDMQITLGIKVRIFKTAD